MRFCGFQCRLTNVKDYLASWCVFLSSLFTGDTECVVVYSERKKGFYTCDKGVACVHFACACHFCGTKQQIKLPAHLADCNVDEPFCIRVHYFQGSTGSGWPVTAVAFEKTRSLLKYVACVWQSVETIRPKYIKCVSKSGCVTCALTRRSLSTLRESSLKCKDNRG